MVCIMANKWQPNDRHNNRRFSAMRRFRRRPRSHRRRPAWAHCAQVRRSSVAREQLESPVEVNTDRQLKLFHRKCHRIMRPTFRSVIHVGRIATHRRTAATSDPATQHCRKCNKCLRITTATISLCFIPIIPIHSFFIRFSISNRITMIVHQALTCLVRLHESDDIPLSYLIFILCSFHSHLHSASITSNDHP